VTGWLDCFYLNGINPLFVEEDYDDSSIDEWSLLEINELPP
jgi:hypothetical protein